MAYVNPYAAQQGFGQQGGSSGCVLLLNKISPRLNCEKIFNLFCIYGNVQKIKFLTNKDRAAMIQFTEPQGAKLALEHLNNIVILGEIINISMSKHDHIAGRTDMVTPLPDNTPSTMDFNNSPLWRYKSNALEKNAPAHPGTLVHFYNAPLDVTQHEIIEAIESLGSKSPISFKMFNKAGSKTQSGLMDFASVADAVDAITLANHIKFLRPESHVFTMRLCFSLDKSRQEAGAAASSLFSGPAQAIAQASMAPYTGTFAPSSLRSM